MYVPVQKCLGTPSVKQLIVYTITHSSITRSIKKIKKHKRHQTKHLDESVNWNVHCLFKQLIVYVYTVIYTRCMHLRQCTSKQRWISSFFAIAENVNDTTWRTLVAVPFIYEALAVSSNGKFITAIPLLQNRIRRRCTVDDLLVALPASVRHPGTYKVETNTTMVTLIIL